MKLPLLSVFKVLFMFCAFVSMTKAQNFSPLESEILKEINRVRKNPAAYADWIEANRNRLPYTPVPERMKVIDEAVRQLRATAPMAELTASAPAYQAAKKQLEENLPTGVYTHSGKDGSSVKQRLNRVGKLTGAYAENAVLMNPEDPLTAERVVLVWIIDDIVPNRGHRQVLLDKNLLLGGIACGKFPSSTVYKDYSVCVANFAQQLL